ncbi:hypothetical protein LCGC14_2591050 [marine sediment metagenome]|uniref:HNH nuclease domain-containing protein n=1 Tax=marine sediment metagenome TaxID=412755 RepID=A0A0F9ABX3_9ZZZZ
MKQIPGFPNYSVTKDGRVWSHRRPGTKGMWVKHYLRSDENYITVELYEGGKKHVRKIHCLILETYVGTRPTKLIARHLNGDKYDNRLGNLCWGTRSENAQDSVKHGTAACLHRIGEKHPRSKLSNRDRRMIIYQYASGLFSRWELSKLYNMSMAAIWDLTSGRLWPYIDARKLRHV